jgi:hypothetical protein
MARGECTASAVPKGQRKMRALAPEASGFPFALIYEMGRLPGQPGAASLRALPRQIEKRTTSFYGCAGAGVGAGVVVAGLLSKFTLGACRAPSSVLKYASFRVNPPRLATRLFGNNDMYVL